jgi:hypothetical protein
MSTATTAPASSTRKRTPTPEWRTVYNKSRKSPDGDLYDLAQRTKESVLFEARPCGGTAAWSWDAKRKRHIIVLDRDFPSTINGPLRSTRTLRVRYGECLLRHEKWHGLRTDHDLSALAAQCDTRRIPFELLNVAEDLRIEHLARLDEKRPFSWMHYNADPAKGGTKEPLAWLASYILHEVSDHSPSRVELYMRGKWKGEPQTARKRRGVVGPMRPTYDVLAEFAQEMANAKSTRDVLDIVQDWVDTFPAAKHNPKDIPRMPSRMGGVGYATGRGGSTTSPDYSGGCPKVDPSTLPPAERRAVEYFLGGPLDLLRLSDEDFHTHAGRRPVDMSNTPHVANKLAALLGSVDPMRVRIATSGSRVHVRGVMTGDPSSFRSQSMRSGKRKVVAIFDQSGSMMGDWYRHGATFAAALLTLHRRGIIDATVILTGGRSHATVPPSMDPSALGRFPCNMGCESVDATLAAHKDKVQAADTVLIYTDGHLTDGDVDAGKWRSLGVDLVGCAVGRSHVQEMLQAHFARGITAESGAELATRIVQYIATRK